MSLIFRKISLVTAIALTVLALWKELYVPLPNAKHPLRFYSNQGGTHLKYFYKTALKKTKHHLITHAYDLSDPEIFSLVRAKSKSLSKIQLFVDGSTTKKLRKNYPDLPWNLKKGSALMHEKILCLDKACTYLGSANFSTDSLLRHDNFVLGVFSSEIANYIQEHHNNRRQNLLTKSRSFCVGANQLTFYFFPDKKQEGLRHLLELIKDAKDQIDLAIYTFTHPKIAKELLNARKRGVQINLYLDHSTSRGASRKLLETLSKESFPVHLSSRSKLLHYKMMLIDNSHFVFGSSNWTKSAFTKNHDYLVWVSHLEESQTKALRKIFRSIDKQSKLFHRI